MNEENKQELSSIYGKIVTSCDICGNPLNNGGDEFKITVKGAEYTFCPDCAIKYSLFDLYENDIIPDIAQEYHDGEIVYANSETAG